MTVLKAPSIYGYRGGIAGLFTGHLVGKAARTIKIPPDRGVDEMAIRIQGHFAATGSKRNDSGRGVRSTDHGQGITLRVNIIIQHTGRNNCTRFFEV
jgi:hypothetical protein